MVLIKNISNGPRGVYDTKGKLAMLEPGEERDIDLAKGEEGAAPEWFEYGGKASAPAPASDEIELLGAMTDDELRDLIEQKSGKRPHPNAKRDTLLDRAGEVLEGGEDA